MNSSTSGLFVARYDLSGHQIWIRLFGDPTISMLGSVAVGTGGVVAAGFLNGRGFVKDYDPNGTELWTRLFSSSQVGDNVYEASEGVSGIYSVGNYRFTNGSSINALQAHDFTGSLLWNRTLSIDSGGSSRAFNVHASSEGVYVSSFFDYGIGSSTIQRYDLNGARVWTLKLDCASCSATSVSGDGMAVYVSGYVNPIGGNGFFLNKYDLSGNPVWSRKFTADYGSSNPIRMTVDSSGIYLAIPSVVGSVGYVVKYDTAGGEAWSLSMKAADPRDVSEEGGIVYVGGASRSAFLAAFWQSSSLVFLGLNPPFSFVMLATIAAVIVLGILLMIRRYRIPDLSRKPVLKGVPIDAVGPSFTWV
jgi:hypothetical protein